MITYARFSRRAGALLAAILVDLFVLAALQAAQVGSALDELFAAWLAIHHIGLVAEGGSLGHRLLGLRVTRLDGTRPGVVRAIIRILVTPLSWLPLGLGLLWMLDQRERRTWHDLAAGTLVVRETTPAEVAAPQWAATPPWRAPQ